MLPFVVVASLCQETSYCGFSSNPALDGRLERNVRMPFDPPSRQRCSHRAELLKQPPKISLRREALRSISVQERQPIK